MVVVHVVLQAVAMFYVCLLLILIGTKSSQRNRSQANAMAVSDKLPTSPGEVDADSQGV